MFMEAPLPQAEEKPAEPETPAVDGASDAKGWTVFMDKSPVQMPQGQGPGPSGPMGFAKADNPAAPPAEAITATPGGAPAPAPAEDPAKGRTIIAGAAHAPQQAVAAGPMAFKQASSESSDVVAAPQTTGAVEKVAASAPVPSGPRAVAPGSAAPIAQAESGGGAKIGIAVIVLAVVAVVAYLLLT
jgi:hypothetical protein